MVRQSDYLRGLRPRSCHAGLCDLLTFDYRQGGSKVLRCDQGKMSRKPVLETVHSKVTFDAFQCPFEVTEGRMVSRKACWTNVRVSGQSLRRDGQQGIPTWWCLQR